MSRQKLDMTGASLSLLDALCACNSLHSWHKLADVVHLPKDSHSRSDHEEVGHLGYDTTEQLFERKACTRHSLIDALAITDYAQL